MAWTRFMDMHSGGGLKEAPYEYIYIEASEEEAVEIFEARFGHNPYWVACDCCGENYSVSEYASLEQASAYDRGCKFVHVDAMGNQFDRHQKGLLGMYVEEPSGRGKYVSMEEFLQDKKCLFIYADSLKSSNHIDI